MKEIKGHKEYRLYPCPFCGSKNEDTKFFMNQGMKWGGVLCGCGIYGPDVRTGYDVAEDAFWHEQAVNEWNECLRRPQVKYRNLNAQIDDYYIKFIEKNYKHPTYLIIGPEVYDSLCIENTPIQTFNEDTGRMEFTDPSKKMYIKEIRLHEGPVKLIVDPSYEDRATFICINYLQFARSTARHSGDFKFEEIGNS